MAVVRVRIRGHMVIEPRASERIFYANDVAPHNDISHHIAARVVTTREAIIARYTRSAESI